MGKRTFVGLDCEMTGNNPNIHELIQIGICLDARNPAKNLVADVGWDSWEYQPEAMQVNRFTSERIKAASKAYIVETKILEFLEENGVKKGSVIPVGWKVDKFDLPFVYKTFPNIWHYFVYPKQNPIHGAVAIDLTTPAMTFGYNRTNKEMGYRGWKNAAKRYAEEELAKIGIKPAWHDAGYDAKAALLCLEFFSERIRKDEG